MDCSPECQQCALSAQHHLISCLHELLGPKVIGDSAVTLIAKIMGKRKSSDGPASKAAPSSKNQKVVSQDVLEQCPYVSKVCAWHLIDNCHIFISPFPQHPQPIEHQLR